MGWQGWYTLAVFVLVFAGLVRGAAPADMLLLAGTIAVALAGVISPEQALSGFSNQGMLTVAALFVVAAGLRETGALEVVGGWVLGQARTERGALLRLVASSAGLSAFLNNTAVVAMLMPIVSDWCRRHRVSTSRMLMPLSFATILGGTCTLIGTSTNLVVDGLMAAERRAGADGLAPIRFFEPALLGLPLLLAGMVYLLTAARRLIPDRQDLIERFSAGAREYLVNMRVDADCPLVGATVEAAGLRRLPGLFLVEIVREGRIIAPVEPNETLLVGDRLTFTGAVNTIVDLERIRGLVPERHAPDETMDLRSGERHYCEAVVSATSPLIDRTIRDANFRALYNAAVVAVHRGGERLAGRVGDIQLRPGDTLLLQTGPNFERAHRNSRDFYLVSLVPDARGVRHERSLLATVLLGMLVALLISGLIPTVMAAMLVAGAMVATRCISAGEARRSMPWDVLLTIAASFGLGAALEESGVAALAARELVALSAALGPAALVVAIYGVTMLLTEFITNNAAAVLVFPLAMAAAEACGLNPRPLAIAVMFAASASFSTPIGYQTNLMVYGPGGYRFSDFLRVGLPLNLLMWVLSSLLIPWIWELEAA